MTGLRTAPAAIVLLAMVVAAAIFTAAPPISGDEPRETVILPTITISATGGDGVTTVTEGTDISLTITADPATSDFPWKFWVYPSSAYGTLHRPPPTRPGEIHNSFPDSYRTVTVACRKHHRDTARCHTTMTTTTKKTGMSELLSLSRSRVRTYIVGDDAQLAKECRFDDNDITLPPPRG